MSDDLRLLHTMIRVKDVDAPLSFYCDQLGMVVRRRADYEDGRFSLIYLGYEDETEGAVLELTHNWDQGDDVGDQVQGVGFKCFSHLSYSSGPGSVLLGCFVKRNV